MNGSRNAPEPKFKEAADSACMRSFGVVGAPGNDFGAGGYIGPAGTEMVDHHDPGLSLPFASLSQAFRE